MAAQIMKKIKIDGVFVGADRIASNGDTANKIGTYSLAVLAKYHISHFMSPHHYLLWITILNQA